MKFFIELAPPTGALDVQWVGMLGDGRFVVEAETYDEAEEKLFDLLTKTMVSVGTRLATEDEAKGFTEQQWTDFLDHAGLSSYRGTNQGLE